MKTLFTIGFTKKTAEQFFTMLKSNGVMRVLDVRINNTSQLSRFSIYPDIKFFLSLFDIEYEHSKLFTPDPFVLKKYREGKITWAEYEERFDNLMDERGAVDRIRDFEFDIDRCCLLCAEESAKFCHRRLVAELISETVEDTIIEHLGDPLWNMRLSF